MTNARETFNYSSNSVRLKMADLRMSIFTWLNSSNKCSQWTISMELAYDCSTVHYQACFAFTSSIWARLAAWHMPRAVPTIITRALKHWPLLKSWTHTSRSSCDKTCTPSNNIIKISMKTVTRTNWTRQPNSIVILLPWQMILTICAFPSFWIGIAAKWRSFASTCGRSRAKPKLMASYKWIMGSSWGKSPRSGSSSTMLTRLTSWSISDAGSPETAARMLSRSRQSEPCTTIRRLSGSKKCSRCKKSVYSSRMPQVMKVSISPLHQPAKLTSLRSLQHPQITN